MGLALVSGHRRRVLVTGGAGFIGSAVLRHLLRDDATDLAVLDALTYAATRESLPALENRTRLRFIHGDIRDAGTVATAFSDFDPDAIIHLAAESHVDRSIDAPRVFVETNVVGTTLLLTAARDHWARLPSARASAFRFLHVSTDEVFGALGPSDPAFTSESPHRPNSPYAASKSASDMLVRSWHRTYGLPTIISNCSNNFGPFQFPEKLIPTTILNGLAGKPIPVYGQGRNIRDWLAVADHADALAQLLTRGHVGETYLVGGGEERANLDLVTMLCGILDDLCPAGAPHARLITHVDDRPGHDFRYAVDYTKAASHTGWKPGTGIEDALADTVRWYRDARAWWSPLRGQNAAFLRRRGLAGQAPGEH